MAYRESVFAALLLLAVAKGNIDMDNFNAHYDTLCDRLCPGKVQQCPLLCPSIPPCPKVQCPIFKCPDPQCPDVCPSHRECPIPECPTCPAGPLCPACSDATISCPEHRSSEGSESSFSSFPCPTCPICPSVKEHGNVLPSGYERYPYIAAFKAFPQHIVWKEANEICVDDGGHLAIPDSSVELNIILTIMKENNISYIHIGFHDYDADNKFTTALGQSMTQFQNSLWRRFFPAGFTMAGVQLKDNGKMWNMVNHETRPFICEVPSP